MDSRFLDAFNQVLAHGLDKAMLLELLHADEELSYEELRQRIGSPPSRTYQCALDRLIDHALVNRRLGPLGDHRHETKFSPTQRGNHIAQTLHGLANDGRIPDKIQNAHREELRHAFQGRTLELQTTGPESTEETTPKPLSPGYVTNSGFPAYRKEMEELIAEIQAEREAADNQPDEEA